MTSADPPTDRVCTARYVTERSGVVLICDLPAGHDDGDHSCVLDGRRCYWSVDMTGDSR